MLPCPYHSPSPLLFKLSEAMKKTGALYNSVWLSKMTQSGQRFRVVFASTKGIILKKYFLILKGD